MQKILNYLFVGLIVIASLSAVGVYLFGQGSRVQNGEYACPMDAFMCPDGTAVGRMGPSCEFAPCTKVDASTRVWIQGKEDLIVVDSPRPGDRITSPVTITGKARGSWFFEGSFPIEVGGAIGIEGVVLGQGIATAQGEWMTSEFVPFTGTIHWSSVEGMAPQGGSILLIKSNPSGLLENEDLLEIPVTF